MWEILSCHRMQYILMTDQYQDSKISSGCTSLQVNLEVISQDFYKVLHTQVKQWKFKSNKIDIKTKWMESMNQTIDNTNILKQANTTIKHASSHWDDIEIHSVFNDEPRLFLFVHLFILFFNGRAFYCCSCCFPCHLY